MITAIIVLGIIVWLGFFGAWAYFEHNIYKGKKARKQEEKRRKLKGEDF